MLLTVSSACVGCSCGGCRSTVEDVVHMIAARTDPRLVHINCLFDERLPDEVIGDVARFRQVLLNLCGYVYSVSATMAQHDVQRQPVLVSCDVHCRVAPCSNSVKFTHSGETTIKVTLYDEAQHCLKRYHEANSLPLRQRSGGSDTAAVGSVTGLRPGDASTLSIGTTPSSASRAPSGVCSVDSTPAPTVPPDHGQQPQAQLQHVCHADDCVRWEACMAQAQQRAAITGAPIMMAAPRFRPRSYFFLESAATKQHAAPHMHLPAAAAAGAAELPSLADGDQLQDITVLVEVIDTGIGVPAEKASLLFQKFRQIADRRYGGTGLGLPICEKLTGLQGGSIWVVSSEGAGSTFTFTARLQVQPSAWRRHTARAAAVQHLRRAVCAAVPQLTDGPTSSQAHTPAVPELQPGLPTPTPSVVAFTPPHTLSTPVLRALVDPSSSATPIASGPSRGQPPSIPAVVTVSRWPTDRLAIDMLLTSMGHVPLHVDTITEAEAVYEALPPAGPPPPPAQSLAAATASASGTSQLHNASAASGVPPSSDESQGFQRSLSAGGSSIAPNTS